MSQKKIEQKRVLVTGAGTGIGKGIAEVFAEEGAAVVLHYSHSVSGAEAAVEQIRSQGGQAECMQADFTDVDSTKRLAEQAIGFLGGIDVLVNNAGITMTRPVEDVTPEQFDTVFHVNIRAMFFLTQAVVPHMADQGKGIVINLSSNHAYAGMTEHSVYAATKAAIVGFTRTLSLELAPKGIRVNCIAPGWVIVENHFKVNPDLVPEDHYQDLPAGFIATPRDIGRLAIFLASDDSRYMVGQTVIADGGATSIMANTGDFRTPRTEIYGQGYVPGL